MGSQGGHTQTTTLYLPNIFSNFHFPYLTTRWSGLGKCMTLSLPTELHCIKIFNLWICKTNSGIFYCFLSWRGMDMEIWAKINILSTFLGRILWQYSTTNFCQNSSFLSMKCIVTLMNSLIEIILLSWSEALPSTNKYNYKGSTTFREVLVTWPELNR